MGSFHDMVANEIGDKILQNIRQAVKPWSQVFSNNVFRVGDWGWPRPDFVCLDNTNDETYALEFKPPKQSKREYLTGLGQAIAYLQKHHYSGLIVPEFADDGFPIAKYISETLKSDELKHLPISLISYDENNEIDMLKPITKRRADIPKSFSNDKTVTFWCWWRDMSHYEVFQLLEISDKFRHERGDVYSYHIYPDFAKKLFSNQTKDWDGNFRNKQSVKSISSEKQNYKIPLFQLGYINQADGKLTEDGYNILIPGKLYGPDSKQFKDMLAKRILIEGRHLELILEIEEYQKDKKGSLPETSTEYVLELESHLTVNGSIGSRKPTAVKTGAKPSYLRDEMKIWNKFGFLITKNNQYFYKKEGYRFNFKEIMRLLTDK